ncbi:MAG: C39 family peptidase [Planctomycetes bacterium]|nr:C39 family peptidase [Planctomycetota bacterium]
MEIPRGTLDSLHDLYARGQYLQAWEAARAHGPLREWTGTDALLIAGRLAANLGAPRLGSVLHVRAWRRDRGHQEARVYFVRAVADRFGPFAAWRHLGVFDDMEGTPEAIRADWFALRASVAGQLRDFDTAEKWLARAEESDPGEPWIQVVRAHLHEEEDRYDDALAAARRALEIRPWFRPGVQAAAHVLQLLNRNDEALALLEEASSRLECASVLTHLGALRAEIGRHPAAREAYAAAVRHSPLVEEGVGRWLAARQSDAAYASGDLAGAAELARQAGGDYYSRLADRLAAPDAAARKSLLSVGFVRQHHVTCAPATLSAISRFWNMPTEHLALAEDICYDGTPGHSERQWAESHGFVAREFTVTWEAAVALLDRGVPFTLTTAVPGSAHLQAVVGYDGLRESLFIRDPYERYLRETGARRFLDRYRATGPRGMAMVPAAQAGLLESLELPDAALYDLLYAMQRSLERHDRAAAAAARDSLVARAPGHRLSFTGRRILAAYDADRVAALEALDGLLALHPGNELLTFSRLAEMPGLARREDRLSLLREACSRPEADPIFAAALAAELVGDARRHDEALRSLRHALRTRERDAAAVSTCADILWENGERERAIDAYRFAACLEDKNESYSASFFFAACHLGREETAVEYLRGRFRRFGGKSGLPARTLFRACDRLNRTSEGLRILDEAVLLRPEDGQLLLFAAEARARFGDLERAREYLSRASGHARRADVLRCEAQLATLRGDSRSALEQWRAIAEVEPLSCEAQAATARHLAELEGREGAVAHIRGVVSRFPHHAEIRKLLLDWIPEDSPEEAEREVRRLLELNPDDAWTQRELALVLSRCRRHEEALAQVEKAHELEPRAPSTWATRARVLLNAGRIAEARAAAMKAVEGAADFEAAIDDLVEASQTEAERRESLAFVRVEIEKQAVSGDGILQWRGAAGGILPAAEILASLRSFHALRPGLWQAWHALIAQSGDMNLLDDAMRTARAAVERFPLIPRLWLDLGVTARLRRDAAVEFEALERAVRVSPTWGFAVRELADAHERAGALEKARELLEQAILRVPTDAAGHGALGSVLWKLGKREEAVERLQRAVSLAPRYEWAWNQLADWTEVLGRPEAPAAIAREVAAKRPGDAQSWLILSRLLTRPGEEAERLRAVDRALELEPRLEEAHDARVVCLAASHRWEEALAACQPAVFTEEVPVALAGRAAWVEAMRGEYARAIEKMKAVLTRANGYAWGWRRLADWCRETGAGKEYLHAAGRLVELEPTVPLSLGYRADARRMTGDRKGCKEDLKRALELGPDYPFAGTTLFDMHIEDREFDKAGEVLEILKAQLGGPEVTSRDVQLCMARRRFDPAADRTRHLCFEPGEDSAPYDRACNAWFQARRGKEGAVVLREAALRHGANPLAAAAWMRYAVKMGRLRHARHDLRKLRGWPATWTRAVDAWMSALEEEGRHRYLRLMLWWDRKSWRSDTRSWAAAGKVLLSLGCPGAAVRWLSDWRGREGLECWMLSNLAASLRDRGRDAEAGEVTRAALALPRDGATPQLEVWAAVDAALGGDAGAAGAGLARLNLSELSPYYRFVGWMLQALLAASAAKPGCAMADTRGFLVKARLGLPGYRYQSALRRLYRRVIARIASRNGGFVAWWWAIVDRVILPP